MANLITSSGDSANEIVDKNAVRAKRITNLIFAIPLLIALYWIVPYGITLFQNVYDLTKILIKCGLLLMLIGVPAGILWMCRAALGHGLEKFAYNQMEKVIANNPTASMRIEIGKAQEREKSFSNDLGIISNKVKDLEAREQSQTKEAIDLVGYADSLKQKYSKLDSSSDEYRKMVNDAKLASNKAAGKIASNERFKGTLQRLQYIKKTMSDLFDAVHFFVENRIILCDQLDADYKTSREVKSAMSNAQSNIDLMQENSIFNRAVRIAQDEIKLNMSTMESVMNNSKSIIEQADMQKGMLDSQGEKLLTDFENGDFALLIENMKKDTSLDSLKEQAKISLTSSQNNHSSQKQIPVSTFQDLYDKKIN